MLPENLLRDARLQQLLQAWSANPDVPLELLCQDDPELLEPLQAAILMLAQFDQGPANQTLPQPVEEECPLPDYAGPYRLGAVIGRGGMGVVVEAQDPEVGRRLALKIPLPAPEPHAQRIRRRFRREAILTGQLEHPGIVPLHQVGELPDGRPFFAMKYVQGTTLAERLERRADPTAELPQLVGIFGQVCQTMAFAHAKGVIHRDLKPANIMVGAYGEVLVMDWGLAKKLGDLAVEEMLVVGEGPVLTLAGQIMGTVAYMAPEQATGQTEAVDRRSDVFGLGAILCEILTGGPPYRAGLAMRFQAERADLSDAFARLDASGTDPELVALARRCLATDPANRPADGEEVAQAIEAYQLEVQARLQQERLERERQQVEAKEQRRRHRWQLAMAVVLVSAVGLGSWWGWETYRDAAEQRQAIEAKFVELDQQLANNPPWIEPAAFEALEAQLVPDGPADLLVRLEQRKRLWQSVQDLDQIRHLGNVWVGQRYDLPRQLQKYPREFRKLGLDIEQGSIQELAQWIRRSPIRPHLVAALDEWTAVLHVLRRYRARDRLLAVTHAVEPGVKLRDPRVWADLDQLRQLLGHAEHAGLSASLAVLVGLAIPDLEQARAWLERASRQHPDWFDLVFTLAKAEAQQQRWAESAGYFRAALAIHPDNYAAWNDLGNVLARKGEKDAAIDAYRTAIRIRPDLVTAHFNLGYALQAKGQLDDAIDAYRDAIRVHTDDASAHYNLGNALQAKGQLDEAINAYRDAIRVHTDYAEAHCNLGHALQAQAHFVEAFEHLRHGHQLGSARGERWRYPSARWVQEAEALVALDARWQRIRSGQEQPASAGACVALAELCLVYHKEHPAAVKLYREAFHRESKLAASHRYHAACAALLAATATLRQDWIGPDLRSWYRRQALDWLTVELEAMTRRPLPELLSPLSHWQTDPDLAGIRAVYPLAILPPTERRAWLELWRQVQRLHEKVSAE